MKKATSVPATSMWDNIALRPYLGEIRRRHGIVDTLALPNMRDLPPVRIESLFVQPLLSDISVSPTSAPETWPEGDTLFEAMKAANCLVLLGDPGSGKTMLANWLSWRLSSGISTPLPEYLHNKLPIPCVLREMDSKLFSPQTTISDLAMHVVNRYLGDRVTTEMKDSILSLVKKDDYVLILDGIDEIPAVNRKTVASWIHQVSIGKARLLATSRSVGYEDYPVHIPPARSSGQSKKILLKDILKGQSLDDQSSPSLKVVREYTIKELVDISTHGISSSGKWATVAYIMPFDPTRVRTFVKNWYLQRSGSELESLTKTEDLLSALGQSEVTQELSRTPNLLSLMAIVHRERANLPDGKALLYKEIANAYINTIDQHRKIQNGDVLAPYSWEIRESWIAYVGFQMQIERFAKGKESKSGVLINEKKVISWIQHAMRVSEVKNPEVISKNFLEWVARRSGLLLPKGEKLYAFVHLSFQEYFCARYIATQIINPLFIKDDGSNSKTINPEQLKIWSRHPLWREVFIYLLELISAERGTAWCDHLIDIIFGEVVLQSEDENIISLSAGILSNRHVHLNKKNKEKLASFCMPSAITVWAEPWFAHDKLPLKAVQSSNFFYIFSDRSEIIGRPNIAADSLKKIDSVVPTETLGLVIKCKNYPEMLNISDFKNLQLLEIDGYPLEEISFISRMSSLTYLALHGSLLSRLKSISTLKELIYLDLSSTNLSRLTEFKSLSNLVDLNLSRTSIKNISALGHLPSLFDLNISNTMVEDVNPLSTLRKLASLNISNTKVRIIEGLGKIKSLILLNVSNTEIEDLDALKNLDHLTFLYAGKTKIKDLSALSKLDKIRRLDVSETKITDVSALIEMKNLTDLTISETHITDISKIANITQLERLDISGTKIRNLSPILQLKNLHTLIANNIDISALEKLKGQVKGLSIIHD
ncbi:NACHT domain-containing protein [Pseudoduganella sp. LjRoot289]|uniref:NACHT domain-containing protein n=1 Tax=Pseudoduganella sp. LjRoot289 TaxID=3342314 RepID=UPI003ED0B59E